MAGLDSIYGRIYCVKNLVNGKCYVGQTILSIEDRWKGHIMQALSSSPAAGKHAFQRAIKKYGTNSFELTLLQECSSWSELNEAERHWIADMGTIAPGGYNLTSGGEKAGGFKHSDEAKENMRQAQTGKKHSVETRKKLSEKASRKGKYSPEGLEKLKQSRKGNTNRKPPKPIDQYDLKGNFIASFRSLTDAAASIGSKNIGLLSSCAKRVHRALTALGFIWRFPGDVVTDADIAALKRRLRTKMLPVVQITSSGAVIKEFASARDASAATGVSACTILKCCRDVNKSAYGFRFRFGDDVNGCEYLSVAA